MSFLFLIYSDHILVTRRSHSIAIESFAFWWSMREVSSVIDRLHFTFTYMIWSQIILLFKKGTDWECHAFYVEIILFSQTVAVCGNDLASIIRDDVDERKRHHVDLHALNVKNDQAIIYFCFDLSPRVLKISHKEAVKMLLQIDADQIQYSRAQDTHMSNYLA